MAELCSPWVLLFQCEIIGNGKDWGYVRVEMDGQNMHKIGHLLHLIQTRVQLGSAASTGKPNMVIKDNLLVYEIRIERGGGVHRG